MKCQEGASLTGNKSPWPVARAALRHYSEQRGTALNLTNTGGWGSFTTHPLSAVPIVHQQQGHLSLVQVTFACGYLTSNFTDVWLRWFRTHSHLCYCFRPFSLQEVDIMSSPQSSDSQVSPSQTTLEKNKDWSSSVIHETRNMSVMSATRQLACSIFCSTKKWWLKSSSYKFRYSSWIHWKLMQCEVLKE